MHVNRTVRLRAELLLQRGLAWAMHEVREMGYRVALHTAGMYPERLAGILPLVDWIGFDVKAPFSDYRTRRYLFAPRSSASRLASPRSLN